jgi:hypothetical protein
MLWCFPFLMFINVTFVALFQCTDQIELVDDGILIVAMTDCSKLLVRKTNQIE